MGSQKTKVKKKKSSRPAPEAQTLTAVSAAAPAPLPPPQSGRVPVWVMAGTIFAAAIAVRLIFYVHLQETPFFDYVPDGFDQAKFIERARNLAEHGLTGAGVTSQAPLYYYFMALVFKVAGPSITVMRLVQLMAGGLACLLVFRIGREVFGTPTGLLAGAAAALCPAAVFYDGILLRASFAALMNLVFVSVLLAAMRRLRPAWWAAAGAAFGMCMLVRPNIAVFVPFLAAGLWLSGRGAPRAGRRFAGALAFMSAGLILVMMPVFALNLSAGEPVLSVSKLGPYVFYVGNAADARGVGYEVPPSYEKAPKDRLVRAALTSAFQNPLAYIKLTGRKLRGLINGYEVPNNMNFYLFQEFSWVLRNPLLSFAILSPLGMLGLLLGIRKSHQSLMLGLFMISGLVSVLVFYVISRFRYPVVPFYIIFSSYAICWFAAQLRCRAFERALAAAAAAAVLWLAAVPNPDRGEPIRGEDWFNLGIAYKAHGNYDSARKAFARVGRESSVSFPARHNYYFYTGALHVQQNEYARAAEAFKQALRFGPESKTTQQNYFFSLGVSELEGRHYRRAAEAFRKVLEIRPGLAAAERNLALCLAKQEAERDSR